jgi:hypothetical protein
MNKTFADRIFDEIVRQFFLPDQNGYSSLRNIASMMIQQSQKEIVDAVVKNLDVEKLAEEMAKNVVQALEGKSYGYGSSNTDQTELKKRVREKVAVAMAERELARMDAEAQS